jgi:hypothetical protein
LAKIEDLPPSKRSERADILAAPRGLTFCLVGEHVTTSRYKAMDEYARADLKAQLESLLPQDRIAFIKSLEAVRWMSDAPREALTALLTADESVAVRAWAARTLGF